MGLRWEGLTPENIIAEFERSATITRRESKKSLRRGAKDILEVSKSQAPIDDGQLEKAHELSIVRLNKDEMGVEITVGGTVDGVDVDFYAAEVHERMAPYGDINLGPRSRAKDDAKTVAHRFVGGKFLERAADELQEGIIQSVANTLPGD